MNLDPHQQRVLTMRLAVAQSGQTPGPSHSCSYRPGLQARELAFGATGLDPGLYHALMDLNFRRSGSILYRPACRGCTECRAIRVPVAHFRPNRSQKRCAQHNADLVVTAGPPTLTPEKHKLYQGYLALRHDRQMSGSWQSLHEFLYDSPLDTREVIYHRDGRLIAVGIIDVEPEAISTVYCYYDPEAAESSPGTFNVLWSIDYARQNGIPYVYLGYYVFDCSKMNYKINFRPCELLRSDGSWERVER